MKTELNDIKKTIIPILKSHKVTKASIFGSYARGDHNKQSDIDILVKVDDSVGLIEFIKLKSTLQKALGRKVDLVEYDTIRSEIKDNILEDEVSILA